PLALRSGNRTPWPPVFNSPRVEAPHSGAAAGRCAKISVQERYAGPDSGRYRAVAEYLRGELRIDLGQLRRHRLAQHRQRRCRGRRGGDDLLRPVEGESGVVEDIFDRVPGMNAVEAEASTCRIETEAAAIGDQ